MPTQLPPHLSTHMERGEINGVPQDADPTTTRTSMKRLSKPHPRKLRFQIFGSLESLNVFFGEDVEGDVDQSIDAAGGFPVGESSLFIPYPRHEEIVVLMSALEAGKLPHAFLDDSLARIANRLINVPNLCLCGATFCVAGMACRLDRQGTPVISMIVDGSLFATINTQKFTRRVDQSLLTGSIDDPGCDSGSAPHAHSKCLYVGNSHSNHHASFFRLTPGLSTSVFRLLFVLHRTYRGLRIVGSSSTINYAVLAFTILVRLVEERNEIGLAESRTGLDASHVEAFHQFWAGDLSRVDKMRVDVPGSRSSFFGEFDALLFGERAVQRLEVGWSGSSSHTPIVYYPEGVVKDFFEGIATARGNLPIRCNVA